MEKALIPVQDVERMATAIAKSQLFGLKTPEQAMALMFIAQAQGRHPASVAMEYDIIQNKPALKSQAALMRFQEAGGKIKYITRTDAEVAAEFSHPQGGTLTVTWTMARAAKMGLSEKDNWKKQPMIMMQWRVVAEGVRACFPACLGGSYLVEEVQDFSEPEKKEMIDRTPTQPAEATPCESFPHMTPEEAAGTVEGEVLPPSQAIVIGMIEDITYKATRTGSNKYTIIVDGERYGTFDKNLAENAKLCRDQKKRARIVYTDDSYGHKAESVEVYEG